MTNEVHVVPEFHVSFLSSINLPNFCVQKTGYPSSGGKNPKGKIPRTYTAFVHRASTETFSNLQPPKNAACTRTTCSSALSCNNEGYPRIVGYLRAARETHAVSQPSAQRARKTKAAGRGSKKPRGMHHRCANDESVGAALANEYNL